MNHNMWLMSKKGDVKTLEYLISQGKSVNAKNSMCEAPLHIAVAEEKDEAARLLIDNGAVVNVRNGLTLQTPLHIACENNDVKCASLLLERGADPELTDKEGITPRDIVKEHNYRILDSLITAANEVVACKLRCGAYVLRRLATAHLERDCPQRFVKCRLGCGAEIPVAETFKHESKSCLEAIIPCWNGCGQKFRRRRVQRHAKLECPFGAKTKCRFGCTILRSEQHAHELAHLERKAILWSASELGFWMLTTLYKKLGEPEKAMDNTEQEFDLLAGTGMTEEEAAADAAATAREAQAAEDKRKEEAEMQASRRRAAAAAGAGGAGAGTSDGEEEGSDGAREDGSDEEDAKSIEQEVVYTLDANGERMPQADFVPKLHGVVPPPSDQAVVSAYDYTLALESSKITGRVLCLFAANATPVDAMEWLLQRLGVSAKHRRVIVEDFLALTAYDQSVNEAVAATALPVAIGDAHEFVVEGETFVNKFTSFAAVRNNVAETPGLKWALPKHYRFVSMHTNRDILGGKEEENTTLVKVHGFLVLVRGFNPSTEPV